MEHMLAILDRQMPQQLMEGVGPSGTYLAR